MKILPVVPILMTAAGVWALADVPVHHALRIELDPASHRLAVEDVITLPGAGPQEFELNAALSILSPTDGLETVAAVEGSGADRYRLTTVPEGNTLRIRYQGTVDFGLSDEKEQYTRGFRQTAGIVGQEGVFLAGDTVWYPRFGDGLVTFDLQAAVPEGWHLISQGTGTSRGADGRARWSTSEPMDEIYLVGGPLRRYADSAGAVEALVYLRERDDALAGKYLAATARYIEMYRGLIGPYPYDKFALVENFWETGYGMPSFTLLGSQVIRFPFILTSSYPHEILHNWWGNSVFVDYDSGNWSEGLTAYLADHLIKEQRGQGALHRRDTLQKYRNYVAQGGRDFPLAQFRARHSAATEAVGYGKTLMVFHMLRRRIGDDAFREALARFYRAQRGKRASWSDLRASFEAASGEDLGGFFTQWVERAGVPSLAVRVEEPDRGDDGVWRVRGSLEQSGDGEPYVLGVPVVVESATATETQVVAVTGERAAFEIASPGGRPQRLAVDPAFDVFRLLDPREIPPSIGQIFGEPRVLALLPSVAPPAVQERYRELMEGWRSESHEIEIVRDVDLERLPGDRAVWILGRDNVWSRLFAERIEGDAIVFGVERAPFAGHSLVTVRRHPDNLEEAVGWLVVDPPPAFAGVGRKLPHYGKYSYLAFEGDEPTNVVKGQWPADDSPLFLDLRDPLDRGRPLPPLEPPDRPALAELPPVFSSRRLTEHVQTLASAEYAGRGAGSEGASRAAEYVAGEFERIGLEPGGDDGSYLQRFVVAEGPDGEPWETANVVGVLRGTRADWADQSVVVGAHYDHLGTGWPDVHAGNQGRIHPGADDNASGVAVLLELARNLAENGAGSRNLVFVAFGAEEAGKRGSRHFAAGGEPFPLDGIRAVVNLDTVGRLQGNPVSVLGTGTAEEWQHIFRGCSFVTGVPSRNVPGSYQASDQASFIEAGVPAVQIFTGAHADYHRPGDTPDKIDAAGLVKVATFVKEAVSYLVEREEPLTVTIEGAADRPVPATPSTGRRVLFGTVPDFAYPGPGARVDSVLPGSPAARAGIEAGDVVLRIGDAEVADLRAFADVLKKLEPGQTVATIVRRGDRQIELEVTVEAR